MPGSSDPATAVSARLASAVTACKVASYPPRVAARSEADALAQAVDYYGFKEYRLNGTLAELDCRFFI